MRALRVLGAVLPYGAPAAALSTALRQGSWGHAGNPACVVSQELLMTAITELTVRQQRIVDALRPFFGADADALYEANGRSLLKLAYFARQSSLPSCHRLVTGLALAQELLVEDLTSRSVFDSPRAATDFLKLHFAGQPHESFAVMYLDARNALIAFEELFRGTLTQTSVYPREVMRRCLQHEACALIVSHNHPSGSVEPSRADELLTRTLATALAMMDVRVLDHVIVAGAKSLSFAERGLL
ncbi:JAB domain-containing protein [Variovorax sp. GT1P44]|uniref:JAB domain-containing protein n=1 Tax=Variovorax sp. GT1P44 TaxID=3443742 RepID=UPI003F44EE2F